MATQDLMCFVPKGPAPLKILCVESSLYLPRLRQNLPQGELWAMTKHDDVTSAPEFTDLAVNWAIGDYRRDPLPRGENYFDLVIAESCLETVWEPYESLMQISRSLKDTGFFLGCFLNIRYCKVLENLREGKFPYREERLYAKDEVVKMLNDAIFKEIDFAPFGEVPAQNETEASASAWEKFGFANFNRDLSVKIWMFRAARSTAAVAALKELYAPAVRTELARLLRRLEYDIAPEKSLAALRKLLAEEMIFADYVEDFIEQTIVKKRKVREIVGKII